jgi:hypothetical protein
VTDGSVQAVATSAGLVRPDPEDADPAVTADDLLTSPLDGTALATWGLWLNWDGAVPAACRGLCTAPGLDVGLAESLRLFAGATACETLFELLRADDPPGASSGEYDYPIAALRALAAPFGKEVASLVETHLSETTVPARRAACAMAGATSADTTPNDAQEASSSPALWTDGSSVPTEALRANVHHDHPAVRAAAHDTCTRLGIPTPNDAADHERRSDQSSQPESPK